MWKTADFSFLITIVSLINYVFWMKASPHFTENAYWKFHLKQSTLLLCFPLFLSFQPSPSSNHPLHQFTWLSSYTKLERTNQVKYFSEVAVVWEEISQFIIQMGWDLLEIYCWHLPNTSEGEKKLSFDSLFNTSSSLCLNKVKKVSFIFLLLISSKSLDLCRNQ